MIRSVIILFFLPVLLFGQDVLLTGRVSEGMDKAPVADATVRVFLGAAYGEVVVTTDSKGDFTIRSSKPVMDLDYAITIQKEGYYRLNGTVKLNFGEGQDRYFRLYKRKVPIANLQQDDGPSLLGAPVNNLVFLLDVSGSMREQDRLEDLKESLLFLVSLYRPEDRISIITYSSKVELVLEEGRISEKSKIENIIKGLEPAGTTEGVAGLIKAYDIAVNNHLRGGNNKVVMATDGIFGDDKKSRKMVEEAIIRGVSDEVHLSIFSFGEEAKSISDRLKFWSELGRGNYTHISSLHEAKEQIVLEAKGN